MFKICSIKSKLETVKQIQNKKVPEANGVENREPPAEVVEPKADGGALLGNKEVEAEPSAGADDALPNKVDPVAAVCGVANKEDDMEEDGAEEGVLKRDIPLPEEADASVVAADVCGAVDAPGVAELANKPATCVEGCELAGKCKVGCTRLAAASCFAVSRRSASRNGSFPSPRRRWSAR